MKKSSSDLQYPDTSQFCFGLINGQKLFDLQFPELYLNSVLFIMSCGDYITLKVMLEKGRYLVPNLFKDITKQLTNQTVMFQYCHEKLW